MRLGILGGTYDPVHLGHLLLADQARDILGLDQVLLIPAGRPPHKPDRVITSFDHRWRMLELALEGIPGFHLSDLEADPDAPSFTVETLRRQRSRMGRLDQLWLLLGEDSLLELPSWRHPQEVSRLARIAVYPRPSAREESPPAPPSGEHLWMDGPRLRLSSSEIRQRVREGRSIRFLVPEAVRAYIEDQELYKDPDLSG